MVPSLVIAKRKNRTWAVRPDEMQKLGRSAQQSARTSATRIAQPSVAKRLTHFVQLTAVEHACKMMRADLLVRLIDEDGLRPIDIARATGLRQSDLSQMYATAKTFPPDARADDVPYNIFMLATRMIRKFPELRMRPRLALSQIRRLGLSQHRDVSRHFSQLARLAEMRRALPAPAIQRNGVINSTHRARLQDVLHLIPDGVAKIIHVDPPYIYPTTTDGRYNSGSSRSRLCDDAEAETALQLVRDVLGNWQPKLAPGGVLLLWQASGPLLPQIIESVDQYDWRLAGPVIWDKSRHQPGDFTAPYSRQTEMLWVLSRPGDELVNHDGSSRSDILRFPPVSFPSAASEQDHCFEKPQKLCEPHPQAQPSRRTGARPLRMHRIDDAGGDRS